MALVADAIGSLRALHAIGTLRAVAAPAIHVRYFLLLDLELATADAGFRRGPEALAHVDALLARFEGSDHPLALGMIHETRARIAWAMGRTEEYDQSLKEVERWYGSTRAPILIAKAKRLAELRPAPVRKPIIAELTLQAGADVSTTKTKTASARKQGHESTPGDG